MLEITINNLPAVLKSGTQIKFTRENPFFSEAGDYTLDVTFPLSGCAQNQKIFGAVHRPEASRKALLKRSFTFRLQTGLFSLSGKAAVTSVTQEEVKLQLLAGKSAFNFDSTNTDSGEEVYIDELPLGNMCQRIWDKFYQWTDAHTQEWIDSYSNSSWLSGSNDLLPAALISKAFTAAERSRLMFGDSDMTNCVFFPIYSEEDELWSNELDYRYWGDDIYMGDDANPRHTWRRDMETYFFRLFAGLAFPLPHSQPSGKYLFQRLQYVNGEWVTNDLSIAPQPYLCYVVECIFAALGYTLNPADNALRHGAFKNVFIANARNTQQLADILPHWTVKEFFDNLQKFLNVMVVVEGSKVKVESRNTAYQSGEPTVLRSVTDEQSTDLDEEGDSKDPTSGNVGYDFPDALSAKNNLGDRYEQVEVRRFNSYAEIEADLAALDLTAKQESNILYIDMTTGERYYIAYTPQPTQQDITAGIYELKTIDLMGPLWRTQSGKIDNELKFVPCRMSDYHPTYRTKMVWGDNIQKYAPETPHPVNPDNINLDGGQYGGFHIPYLVTSDTRESIKEQKLNLQQNIYSTGEDEESEDEEATGKREVIELAYNADAEHQFVYQQTYNPLANYPQLIGVQISYPVGIPYYADRFGNWKDEEEHLFVIRNRTGQVAQELDGFAFDIDTRSVTQFQFTDNLFDPAAVVIIRGRKYVCQKLEMTIDENGLQPMKRGYFYEIGS
ncbi:MAG: hypothetical protein IKR63_00650 [Alloprevotella sp.]|nr:hypothetical protein [Bacteroidaceae bacterium]MBR6338629.1 hypothetical protein [Alloprevotella sp.]